MSRAEEAARAEERDAVMRAGAEHSLRLEGEGLGARWVVLRADGTEAERFRNVNDAVAFARAEEEAGRPLRRCDNCGRPTTLKWCSAACSDEVPEGGEW